MQTPIALAPLVPPIALNRPVANLPARGPAPAPRSRDAAESGGAATALDRLDPNCAVRVWRLDAAAAGQPPERMRQLADIGFTPGERVVVLRRAWRGGRIVVLVGQSRFALRSAEAACVLVRGIA